MSGRFIVIEGGDGTGKTTQSRRLADHLGARWTREPGDTTIGAALRSILLEPSSTPMDERCEALLMAADRAQHAAEVIRPALEAGHDVVCDRYTGSSVAYQGYGRDLGADWIAGLSAWATGGLRPDLTILLEVPEAVAEARLGSPDRIEAAGRAFHRRVIEGYRAQAEADPQGWVVVDATGDESTVFERVAAVVAERLS